MAAAFLSRSVPQTARSRMFGRADFVGTGVK